MHFVVIAGPQSSGKTTAFTHLQQKYQDRFDYHPEINQLNVHGVTLGSIAVSASMEEEILQADIAQITHIHDTHKIQIYETAMFHLVYVNSLAPGLYKQAKEHYREAFSGHLLDVIFIDTLPETSFARRRPIYLARIEGEITKKRLAKSPATTYTNEMLQKYEKRIQDLFPIWHHVYDELSYANRKVTINNNKTEEEFLSEFDRVINELSDHQKT